MVRRLNCSAVFGRSCSLPLWMLACGVPVLVNAQFFHSTHCAFVYVVVLTSVLGHCGLRPTDVLAITLRALRLFTEAPSRWSKVTICRRLSARVGLACGEFAYSTAYKCKTTILKLVFAVTASATAVSNCAATESPNMGDLVVHVVKPITDQKILPDTFPLPGERSTTLRVEACAGEFEPASFVVRSDLNDIKALLPTVSDLISNSGVHIASANITIRVVKVWYQAGGAWENVLIDRDRSATLVPELLLNDASLVKVDYRVRRNFLKIMTGTHGARYVDISSSSPLFKDRLIQPIQGLSVSDSDHLLPTTIERGTAQQFWVTVRVPKDAVPGEYLGTIALTDEQGTIGELSLSLKVHDFALLPPKQIYSIYYRGYLSEDGNGSISSEAKSRLQLKRELINMREHGIINPTVYQRYYGRSPRALQRLRDYLALRYQVGFRHLPVYYLGRPTGNPTDREGLNDLSSVVEDILQEIKRYRNTDLYVYGMDEVKGRELTSQRDAWSAVHRVGAKIFVAGSKGHFEEMGEETDLLVFFGSPNKEEAEKFHGVGNLIFSYANPQGGVENPAVYRRNYGLVLWQNDFDGAMPYAYQDAAGLIWNDFDQEPYRDHVFAYPTVNGVIDTIAWEGFREAIDDNRYIATLEELISSSSDPEDSEVVSARAYLNELRNHAPGDLDEIRDKLVEFIVLLRRRLQR